MFKKTVVAAALACAALHSHAAIMVASPPDLTTEEKKLAFASSIVQSIVGSGITPSAPKAEWESGGGPGVATFSDGLGSVGFANGVVLTTGAMGCVRAGNTEPDCTSPASGDLGAQSRVSFSFEVKKTGTLSFVYVFASEEYKNPNSDPTPNNDKASFLLNGVNLAVWPASVDTVNCSTNESSFIDNTGAKCANGGLTRDIEFDGLTTVITATQVLNPGTYTFEFLIEDAGEVVGPGTNELLDSALFLQADSFTFTTPTDPGTVPEPATWALAGLALMAGMASRRRRALL